MSAPVVRQPGDGEANGAFHLPRRFVITAADTGGALSVWEETVPAGSGPPLHCHLHEQEVFRVLDGRLLFQCGDSRIEVAAGGFVLIPAGAPHAFRNVGTTEARLLVTMTPGGAEGFFREVEAARLEPPGDMPTIVAIATRYGLEFVGPPLEP